MTTPLPKWLMLHYAVLWKAFEKNEFSHDDAAVAFAVRYELASVILSSLKKHGWLMMRLDPHDSGRRIYSLKSPERAVNELEKHGKLF